MDHVRHQGLSGLTTGKVADAAGIAQSSFYVYFSDVDDALRAAAEKAGAEVRSIIVDARQQMDFTDPANAYYHAYAGALEALVTEREFTELLLSHRRDKHSPLGKTLRAVLDQARADLAADLQKAGFQEWFARDIDVYAELMVGMTLTAVEAVLDGRIDDKERCLRALSTTTRALASAAVHQR